MTPRRRFITLVPFAGVALLAACSKQSSETAPTSNMPSTPAPAPSPSPSPAAAPQTSAPEAAPAQPPVAQAPAPAQTGGAALPLVSPTEPLAVSLGYVEVASRADATKYANYAPGQACSNCSLYGAPAGAAQGPCPLYASKAVLATAWCSAYVKKAG